MRAFEKDLATVSRLNKVGDTSSYSTVGTVRGFLKPLSEEQSAVNEIQYGKGFSFTTKKNSDIEASDIITIDGIDYTVNGSVFHPTGAGFKKCILENPLKD